MENAEQKLDELMRELEGKEKILDHQTRLLFNLNNHFFPDLQEWTVSCPACRKRVYGRMRQYWEKNKSS